MYGREKVKGSRFSDRHDILVARDDILELSSVPF